MAIDIFLGHLDVDMALAIRLRLALEQAGMVVWSPAADLVAGDLDDELVPQRIAEARTRAFLVTENWPQPGESAPDWDRAEDIPRAVDVSRKDGRRVFAILVEPAGTERIPHRLNRPLVVRTTSAAIEGAAAEVGRAMSASRSVPTAPAAGVGSPMADRAHVVRLTAPVGDQSRVITDDEVAYACQPTRPLDAGLTIALEAPRSGSSIPFETWAQTIERRVRGFIEHRMPGSGTPNIALFGFAPIPLLVKLGRVFGDLHAAVPFERHRHSQTWRWDDNDSNGLALEIDVETDSSDDPPRDIALLVSISAGVKRYAVAKALSRPFELFELRAATPRVNLVRTRGQLADFNRRWRDILEAVHTRGEDVARVHVFAAVPISVAIQMGLGMNPKADPALELYDFRGGAFHHALTLNTPE